MRSLVLKESLRAAPYVGAVSADLTDELVRRRAFCALFILKNEAEERKIVAPSAAFATRVFAAHNGNCALEGVN